MPTMKMIRLTRARNSARCIRERASSKDSRVAGLCDACEDGPANVDVVSWGGAGRIAGRRGDSAVSRGGSNIGNSGSGLSTTGCGSTVSMALRGETIGAGDDDLGIVGFGDGGSPLTVGAKADGETSGS